MTIEFGKIITDYLKNEGYEGNSMDVGWIFSTAPASLQLFLVYLADYLQEHMEQGELIKCETDFSSDTQRTSKKDSSKDNSYAELQQELEHEEKALVKQLKVLDADEARIDADIQLKCTELRSSFISSSNIEWDHSEYLKQKRSEIEKCLSKFETWLDCLDYQWNNLQNTNGAFNSYREIQLQIDELVRIYTNLETKSAETNIETAILRGQIEAMNNTVHPGELYDRISLETKRKELNQLKDTVLKDSLVLSDICKYEILLPILKTQAEHRKECLVALQDHLNVLQDNAKDVLKQLISYSALTSEQRDIITTLVSTKSSCKSQIKDIVTNSKDRIAVLNHFYKGKTEVEKQLIHEQDSFLNNLNELINGDQEANNLYTSLAELRSKAEEFVSKLDISARDKEAEVEHLARTTEQELLQLFTSSFDRSFHPSRSLKNANLLKAQVETISVAGKMQQKINDAVN